MRFSLFFGLALLSTVGCGSNELPPPFPLAWQGVESTPSLTERGRAAVASKSFRIERVVDKRADKSKIGTDEESRTPFRTTSNVADYATDRVRTLLKDSGLKIDEAGTYVIQSELVEFKVDEGNEFKGDVRVLFRVFKPGAPAYENTYLGKASSFGRTHSTDNLNEALSTAMLSAISQFLHDEALATYFEKSGATVTVPAPGANAVPAPAPKSSGPRTL